MTDHKPEETVKMLHNQQQPQLHQVVTLLDNAKDILDQNKSAQDKIFPRISMQTEIR